jgi:hypothetical protein
MNRTAIATLLTTTLLGLSVCTGAESREAEAGWQKLRQQALNRPRRIIFNNDGNEPVYLCKTASKEELLRYRTAPLAGSQVDSIFYCTWSSGFGLFTHLTKAGQIYTGREGRYTNNCMPEFVRKGIDPLKVMTDFAHENSMELFWSFRVNDTHDGSRTDYGPIMFRANRLKQQHPEWLIGSKDKPPRYGSWSAVDFSVPEVRDLAFRFCEEVGQNYDVDGIEMDFFRHAFFFKCSGAGKPCGAEELGQMTALVRRIRERMEELGRKRNRPLLLAVRVPDSVEYCRFIGLDLEAWLKEGLVDLLITTGYIQLNPWEYSVALGHKYGVKVYPSLDESRVRDESARQLRESLPTYRGRALNVWAAGADGVYLFNFFDPTSPLWRELGDPAKLRQLERNYFASVRGVGSVQVPHQKFIRVPTLNPASPVAIAPGKPGHVEFMIGEETTGPTAARKIALRLHFKPAAASKQPQVRLNGTTLSEGQRAGDWIEFHPAGTALRKGTNTIEVALSPGETSSLSLLDLYVTMAAE